MFFLKKLIFKFMELGLGLRTCFSLDTKNPIFVNFKLSEEEAAKVRKHLPPGFELKKIRFTEAETEPHYWISYNLYELNYPKKELQHIKKVRCEINTFVQDADGRKGVYVFCGSPYVSREKAFSPIGFICDLAERLVIFIYGCGKLIDLAYKVTQKSVTIDFKEGSNRLTLQKEIPAETGGAAEDRLSSDYWAYNDVSFFNEAKTYDLVNVNSSFFAAKLKVLDGIKLEQFKIESPILSRPPDHIYLHEGEISYMVNSMNRSAQWPQLSKAH